MDYELTYNARTLPFAEVAETFIPPERHFLSLASRNHTLLVGPRGSGKTTLLKMLTFKALAHWSHPKASAFSKQVKFNAAFIPVDDAWRKQIEALNTPHEPHKDEAIFSIHTLRALVRAMRDAINIPKTNDIPSYLDHLCVKMAPIQEREFVEKISNTLEITPNVKTLMGVELALEEKLSDFCFQKTNLNISVDNLFQKITFLINTFNLISGDDDRQWGLLFDEFEMAPLGLKNALFDKIRRSDPKLIIKLAMAPYMQDKIFDYLSHEDPHPLHDYRIIQLTYPNKKDASLFAVELFKKILEHMEVKFDSLQQLFGKEINFDYAQRKHAKRKKLPSSFKELYKKDESFKRFADEKGFLKPTYSFSEENVAADIRKGIQVVAFRNFYLKEYKNDEGTLLRTRKSYEIYTGLANLVDITEGNPRAILTLVVPMARDHKNAMGEDKRTISTALQHAAIRRVDLLATSLLRATPLETNISGYGASLLEFIGRIGRHFSNKLLMSPFSSNYIGSFILDKECPTGVRHAVGKALNAGALIHVPHQEGGGDAILRGLVGQRFRISYSLSPRHRLLTILGGSLRLSGLLEKSLSEDQYSLFD